MKTIDEAAKDYASRQWGDYPLKSQERIITKEDFKAGIKFAETWIPVEQEMPEDNEWLIDKTDNDIEETIKVLVMTDQGDITDNRRLKMAVGKKEWVWFMGYDGDAQVVKWRPLNVL